MRKALQWLKAIDAKDWATLVAVVLVGAGVWGLQGWAAASIIVGAILLFILFGLILLGEARSNGVNRQHPEQ